MTAVGPPDYPITAFPADTYLTPVLINREEPKV